MVNKERERTVWLYGQAGEIDLHSAEADRP